MYSRLIARLDIKGPNLVKGIQFEGLRVLGLPEIFARHYYENGIDELIYMDAVASLYGRNSLLEIIQRTAKEIFIPLKMIKFIIVIIKSMKLWLLEEIVSCSGKLIGQ